jgi:LuxR family maltose regulon positive regulatory protein
LRRPFTRHGASLRGLLLEHRDSGTAYWSTVTEMISATDGANDAGSPVLAVAPLPGGLAEPLTDRELTILRYLQSILSNVEIAAELRVSVNTVKTHVRNIYRKLEAPRRREAVRRARQLRLL